MAKMKRIDATVLRGQKCPHCEEPGAVITYHANGSITVACEQCDAPFSYTMDRDPEGNAVRITPQPKQPG